MGVDLRLQHLQLHGGGQLALSLVFMARINRTVIVPLSEKQDAAV